LAKPSSRIQKQNKHFHYFLSLFFLLFSLLSNLINIYIANNNNNNNNENRPSKYYNKGYFFFMLAKWCLLAKWIFDFERAERKRNIIICSSVDPSPANITTKRKKKFSRFQIPICLFTSVHARPGPSVRSIYLSCPTTYQPSVSFGWWARALYILCYARSIRL
jgi:hypothetical protein